MPHVQVIGPLSLQDLVSPLSHILDAAPPLVLKIQEAYLSHDAKHLLLESVVVEGYLRQGFFLLIRQEEQGVLIRCHPTVPVQKTDGVKKLIALVARTCIDLCRGSHVGHTNLQAYLGGDLQKEPPEQPHP
ncbi:MAG: hypothetical protein KAY24_17280 [Candidatus Eisenbacteria sp.]|nr:hypothetical protein [Candidatus Eisenbacteria bacterium]